MQTENPKHDFHWKNKLEGLESLPGEAFNKEGAWDKLHGRLKKKNGNNKLVWWQAAAACLLIAFLLPWWWQGKKEDSSIKNNITNTSVQNPGAMQSTLGKNDSVAVISSATPVEKKEPGSEVEKKNKIINLVAYEASPIESVAVKNEKVQSTVPDITSDARIPIDTRINIAAAVPERKKLPVIHINELGDPVPESPAFAHKAEGHSFQFKVAGQEVFVNPSASFKKTGFTILSTRNSPN